MNNSPKAWIRLAQLAGKAPSDAPGELPLGFATRVVARWREQNIPGEDRFAVLQTLTLRSLLVAMVILASCIAFGYQSVSGMLGGETALAGSWLHNLLAM